MRLEDGEMLVVVEQKHIGFERGDIQGVSLWVSPQYDKGRGVLLTPAQAREVGRALVAHADAAEGKATPFAIRERGEAQSEEERLTQERDGQAARIVGELAAEKVRSAQFSAWWEKSEAEVQEARAKETTAVTERDEAKRRAEDAGAKLAAVLEELAKARHAAP